MIHGDPLQLLILVCIFPLGNILNHGILGNILNHYNIDMMVWNMTCSFPSIGIFIISIDELIFFRGVGIPPTRLVIVRANNIGDNHNIVNG